MIHSQKLLSSNIFRPTLHFLKFYFLTTSNSQQAPSRRGRSGTFDDFGRPSRLLWLLALRQPVDPRQTQTLQQTCQVIFETSHVLLVDRFDVQSPHEPEKTLQIEETPQEHEENHRKRPREKETV